MAAAFPLILFPFCLIAAALTDMRRYIIPNELSILLIAGFAVSAVLVGMPFAQIVNCVLAGIAVLAVGFGLYCLNVFGAGDAKILAAIALWFGFPAVTTALVYVALAGGALSLGFIVVMIFAKRVPAISARFGFMARIAAMDTKPKVPYGVAIAVGALLAFETSPLLQALIASAS